MTKVHETATSRKAFGGRSISARSDVPSDHFIPPEAVMTRPSSAWCMTLPRANNRMTPGENSRRGLARRRGPAIRA